MLVDENYRFLSESDLEQLLRLILKYLANTSLSEADLASVRSVLQRVRDFVEVICQHELGGDPRWRERSGTAEEAFLSYVTALKTEKRLLELLNVLEGKDSLKMLLYRITKAIALKQGLDAKSHGGDILNVLTEFHEQARSEPFECPPVKLVNSNICEIRRLTSTRSARNRAPLFREPCSHRCDLLLLTKLEFTQEQIADLLGATRSTTWRSITACRFPQRNQG